MIRHLVRWGLLCAAASAVLEPPNARAAEPPNGTLLFQNLRKLVSSFRVDNPQVAATSGTEGPKGLAAADLDGDGINDLVTGNHDGSVAVLFGVAGGAFQPVQYLTAGTALGLRDVITANLTGDSRPEIIAAHPFDGQLYILGITGAPGSRSISLLQTVTTWPGARAVAAGDFDGDGRIDLAVGGAGGGFREYRGNSSGGFTAQPPVPGIPALTFDGNSAKPVFTLHAWKKPGDIRHQLVLTYAEASSVWFLTSPGSGKPLAVSYVLPLSQNESSSGVFDLTMGNLSLESRTYGQPDLITAVPESGEVFIRSYVPPGISPYSTGAFQRLSVPGGPRALSVSDVNGDGWPELLVASRRGNTLSLYLNRAGTLSLSSQTSTGSSPRDVVSADFDGNGRTDAAVINRQSMDVTVHRIDADSAKFFQSPLVQLIQGGATVPSIQDLNGDGANELLYLTLATGEANIQKLITAGGVSRWATPLRYSMGNRPRTLSAQDLNGDRRLDLISTSLGDTQAGGGLTYRLQLADGTFGALVNVSVPVGQGTAMFSEIARDFDGDGRLDVVVAYFDGRIAFFQGTQTGLVLRRTETPFVYAGHVLAAVDVDQDGDLDLVGLGPHEMALVENNGQWFTGGPYRRRLIAGGFEDAYALSTEDLTGDHDPDLTVFSGSSVSRWNGGPGSEFVSAGTLALEAAQGETEFDFDGDGINDRFLLSKNKTKASFYNGQPGSIADPYRVPSANELASGDLDGDGKADLVGTGEYLWVVLSGSTAPTLVPVISEAIPVEVEKVVINEVLASTSDWVAPGANKPMDCIEIFNGTKVPVDLTAWKLRRVVAGEAMRKPDFLLPHATLQPREVRIIYCNEDKKVPWDAQFKLPEDGCQLTLLDDANVVVDTVTYPPQQADISYARLFDGSRSFVYSPLPSIGSTNYDNGIEPPKINFKGLDLAQLKAGNWRFRARAWTPNGMFTMVIFWREVTSSATPRTGSIPLFDDGMHDDGATFDGTFAGDWENPLPPGVPVEFYLSGTDLRWETSTLPDSPAFTPENKTIENYTLALPLLPSGWEISEVVSNNTAGLRDETGKTRDWMELRYTGTEPTAVAGLFLSDSLFGFEEAEIYDVANLQSLAAPNSVAVLYLDATTPFEPSMPRHAPFAVGSNGVGDSIFLVRRLASGVTELVDAVQVPPLPLNIAYARVRPGGPFALAQPTPGGPNAPIGGSVQMVSAPSSGSDCLFVFRGAGAVEASYDLKTWTPVAPWVSNNGIERVYREPMQSRQRFFRVR